MPFAKVYPAYVHKAERKGRTREEVDRINGWLTGYADAGMRPHPSGMNGLAPHRGDKTHAPFVR